MGSKTSQPYCNDERPCFARNGLTGRCRILTYAYQDGKCPFCKRERDVTNGVYYPINPVYTNKCSKP